jgi:periplasmic protein TonB
MTAQLIGGRLLESTPRRARRARSAMASTAIHAGLIALAVWRTIPGPAEPVHLAEHVSLIPMPTFALAKPPERAASPEKVRAHEFQVLEAPPDVPATIPPVDLTRPAALAEDFSGKGIPVRVAEVSLVRPAPRNDPIEGDAADQSPYLLPGQMGPPYPEELRDDRPDGIVVVRFVIDTLGRVETPSMKVLAASHPLFVASVRATLGRLRYLPASLSGRRVRVQMEQRFEFHLAAP